ncbi:MAG: TetR/AcrR family transcriptional regulator [Candidatus Binataceae bacterium]
MRSEGPSAEREEPSFIEAARRAQIIECAIDTIASVGYAQASLARVAKRAGISKGVISYHFAGKDDLIKQIVGAVLRSFDSYVRSRMMTQYSAADLLRVFIESNIAFIGSHRKQLRALIEILTNARAEDGKPLLDPALPEREIESLERILRRGQQKGEFRKFSTRMMAVTIRAAAIDIAVGQSAADPNFDLDVYARELVTTFDLATRRNP